MQYHFRNLVFEGGGVKGIAYVGALEKLKDKNILRNVDRVGGTSAGAINATLLALDYSLNEMRDILFDLDFANFMDDTWIGGNVWRLIQNYGWFKGEYFKRWIGRLIEEKTGDASITFGELQKQSDKDLYLVGANLSTGFHEVFSHRHTPDTEVREAVRISMSLPLFFKSVRFNNRNDVYVDGGILKNYPIKLFDLERYIEPEQRDKHGRATEYYEDQAKGPSTEPEVNYVYNKETLGFRLDSQSEISAFQKGSTEPLQAKRWNIEDMGDYLQALIGTIWDLQDNQHLHSDDWHRTVYIDTIGVGTTDFNLDDQIKKNLIEQGRLGVENYFNWWDDATKPQGKPLNSP